MNTSSTREPSNFTVKYGLRAIIPVSIIALFALFLLVEYLISGRTNSFLLAFSIVFFVTALLLFVGFTITISNRITKKYFHTETMVGQPGRVIRGVPAKTVGTVNVMNEEWSFVCDSDTFDNEAVTVLEVMEDNVTLRVKKFS